MQPGSGCQHCSAIVNIYSGSNVQDQERFGNYSIVYDVFGVNGEERDDYGSELPGEEFG